MARIKITVSEEKLKKIKEFAEYKGFPTSSSLVSVALTYYMNKNPLPKKKDA